MNLPMNDIRYEWLDIPLTDAEIKSRRVEMSKNNEQIELAKAEVKKVKQQIEEQFGVKDRTEANKVILHELVTKKKHVKLKVQIIANEEEATMDHFATEDAEGYEVGQLVFCKDMTREEKNQYGITTSILIRKPYNE